MTAQHNDELTLRPTTEADRTYIARLNFLTDTYGDEHGELEASFDADFEFYVNRWVAKDGGLIAWRGNVPAGGLWLIWGDDDTHGYGYASADVPELAIAVEGRFKGEGIGTVLMESAAQLARDIGAPGLSLAVHSVNERAARLYRHLGFTYSGIDRGAYRVLVLSFDS